MFVRFLGKDFECTESRLDACSRQSLLELSTRCPTPTNQLPISTEATHGKYRRNPPSGYDVDMYLLIELLALKEYMGRKVIVPTCTSWG